MGEEIEHILSEFGLSAKQAKLYIYLAKSDPQKATEISKNLKIHRVEIYRLLKNLETKGLAESTLERPARFTATPFEQVIDLLIIDRKKASTLLEEKKNELLNEWNTMSVEKLPITSDRFVVLSGRQNVYLKILQLVQRTQREILAVTTNLGLLLADHNGFLSQGITEAMERSKDIPVCARLLTQVTKENLDVTRDFCQKLQRHNLRVEVRHLSTDTRFAPRLTIKDNDEAVTFLTPKNMSIAGREETGLWTNCKTVVYALQALFEEMWRSSQSLTERMKELEKLPVNL